MKPRPPRSLSRRLIHATPLFLALVSGIAAANAEALPSHASHCAAISLRDDELAPPAPPWSAWVSAAAEPSVSPVILRRFASTFASTGPPSLDDDDPLLAQATQYRRLIDQAARDAQVDPRLLHAVVAVESGYNPRAQSPQGARGLMQLMPMTARRYGIRNLYDPLQNLQAGARYLRDLLDLFGNDLRLALAAYNAGETAVLRYGSRTTATRNYVPKVLAMYRRLGSLPL